MIRSLHVFACFVMFCSAAHSQRLPAIATPESYDLTFTPDLRTEKFAGDESIGVRVLKSTSEIVLNALDIKFQDVTVTSGDLSQKARVKLDEAKEQAALVFETPISAGPATIHLSYTGTLNHDLRGFYVGNQDNGHKYAATQFEATDARRAFPAFDEPAYKATFAVAIVADKALTVISNTKAVSETPGPGEGKRTVRFAPTPKMSSYLVAFVIGSFEHIEGSADGIPIRIYSSSAKKDMSRFALEVAKNALRYYDHYFGIHYPFGKLDMIALPDFGPGAMENSACITYRESFLLVDEQHAGLESKKFIASVITHEIAHQWFGDLVTMQWWDDIWLNEGFATWMSSKPITAWKPEWHIELNDVNDTVGAMTHDSLENTHPIHQEARTPAQIFELADEITYDKTAAVLRMLESYLGEQTFREGVNRYLEQRAYGNATAADLWNALSMVSHKPVERLMATFVEQPGVPIVSEKAECERSSQNLVLSQQRYVFDRAKFEAGSNEQWQIPVCVKGSFSDGGIVKCELLNEEQQSARLPACSPWLYVNAGARGFYRSGYETDTVRALAKDAEQVLSAAERIMLLADVWASVRVDREKIGDYLSLAEGVASDRTPQVSLRLVQQLDFIARYLVTDADQSAYGSWVHDLFSPLAKEVGWEQKPRESGDLATLRRNLLYALGHIAHDPQAEAVARKIADQALENPASVEPVLASAALPIAAATGDEAFYNRVFDHLNAAKDPGQKSLYREALVAFHQPRLLERTLEYAVSGARSQDSIFIIAQILRNPAGGKLAWDFVRNRWSEMRKPSGPLGVSAGPLVASTETFCEPGMRDEVQSFFSSHPVPEAERTLKQSLEEIGYCIDMKRRQGAQLASWLQNQNRRAEN